MKEKLTISLQIYLEQIYLLQQEKENVRVTDIANALNNTKPSVNRAISTLNEKGYLFHEHYGSIKLSEKGMKAAENIYDANKVIKKFLIDFLDVEEQIAMKEASQISYIISKGTRKKLKKYMKNIKKSNK